MSLIDQIAPITIGIPIAVGCVLLALGGRLPRLVVDVVSTLAAFAVAGLCAFLVAVAGSGRVVTWGGDWTPVKGYTVGVALVVDRIGAGLATLAALLVGCALLYSWRYFESVRAHYHCLLLLFLAGMAGFALSGDLFNMFAFFELMGACAYALTAFRIEDPSAVQGGFNFGIVNSLGAYVTLMGIGIIYSRTGQLGLAQLSVALSGRRPDLLVAVAFVLVCTGWLVKAAAVPFHFWTADAEAVAPSPVCVLFSGAMVELGVYGVARVYWVAFSGTLNREEVGRVLLVFGALTALVGAAMCLMQGHLKRLLAYSTIAHVGLFLVAVGTMTADGLAGGALYVLGHAGAKGALFLLAGLVLNRHRTLDDDRLFGRARSDRLVGVLIVVGALALAALPPFGTGLGKSVAEGSAFTSGQVWAPVLFVAVSAATGAAVLRWGGRAFLGWGRRPNGGTHDRDEERDRSQPELRSPLTTLPATMIAAVAALLLGSLAVGLVPDLPRAVEVAAYRFTDRAAYVHDVLGTSTATSASAVPIGPVTGWTLTGVLLGVLSAGLAVTIAALQLWPARLPGTLRAAGRGLQPVLAGVRSLHSGRIGDYVAWLMLGVAGLTALTALGLA